MNLKELLGEELYNQLMEKLGDKHKVAIISDGNWIPKEKFDNLNEEKKQYKKQVDDLNRQLGELQGKLKDNEDANQTIEDLKKQIESKETELASTRKANAVKMDVLKANPNDVADIIPHLKDDAITLNEDGTVTGLEEQLKALKETKPYLFKETVPGGTGGSKGAGAKDKKGATLNPWAKETFNLTEQGRLLRSDPELAKTLMAQAKS
jgi:prefoldin subunit 5